MPGVVAGMSFLGVWNDVMLGFQLWSCAIEQRLWICILIKCSQNDKHLCS